MKQLLLVAAMVLAGFTAPENPNFELAPSRIAEMSADDWTDFSDRVFTALDDASFEVAALQSVVRYGSYLDIDEANVHALVRVYRNHENDQVRRLAVVALNEIDNDWGIDMLARSYRFEKNESVKFTIGAVVLDHAERHPDSEIVVGQPQLAHNLDG